MGTDVAFVFWPLFLLSIGIDLDKGNERYEQKLCIIASLSSSDDEALRAESLIESFASKANEPESFKRSRRR